MIDFAEHPVSKSVRTGGDVNFEVTLGAGTLGVVSYQWFKGSLPDASDAEAVAGETADVLALTDVTLSDEGYYFCRASDDGGPEDSSVARLLLIGVLRWRGSTEIHEQPGSPKTSADSGAEKTVRSYRGPYAALKDFKPEIGETMEDLEDDDLKVVSSELEPDGAGLDGPGTLVITLSKALDEVIEEIEIGGLEKPVESHPFYALIADSIWARYYRWDQEPNPVLRGDLKYTYTVTYDSYDEETGLASGGRVDKEYQGQLVGLIAGLASKKLRGTTHYIVPAPILRRSTYSNTKPTLGGMGKRVAEAPFENAPAGYQWLKTADRLIYRSNLNRWERTEEWTGADLWDPDLYPLLA